MWKLSRSRYKKKRWKYNKCRNEKQFSSLYFSVGFVRLFFMFFFFLSEPNRMILIYFEYMQNIIFSYKNNKNSSSLRHIFIFFINLRVPVLYILVFLLRRSMWVVCVVENVYIAPHRKMMACTLFFEIVNGMVCTESCYSFFSWNCSTYMRNIT